MKSYNLILFSILAIFVITSEANTAVGQIDEKKRIVSGGYKIWLNEVNGYNKTDEVNGYAGIFGKAITSIRISGGQPYRVHEYQGDWLGKITGNNKDDFDNGYSGGVNGNTIDAFVVGGDVEYAAHVLGGDWLPPVSKYDINDSVYGYAGNFGQPIDAIMVKGRTYAVSYFEPTDRCTLQNGTCMNPDTCRSTGGTLLNGLCPGGEDNKCCIQINVEKQNAANNTNTQAQDENSNLNNQNSGSTHLNVYYIISMILAVFIMF